MSRVHQEVDKHIASPEGYGLAVLDFDYLKKIRSTQETAQASCQMSL